MSDLIDREELLKSIKTCDKFACLPNGKLEPFKNLENRNEYVAYVKLDDIVKAIKNGKEVE